MNWGAFDLNLLIVFDAVIEERNVTRAGDKIGLSQSAVSHALSRLRHMLKDELFIRTPDGMVPTPRAEQLAVPQQQPEPGADQEPGRGRGYPAQGVPEDRQMGIFQIKRPE